MSARLIALVLLLGPGPAAAADDRDIDPDPVHAFVQGGTGLTELAHVEAGAFLGAHLTLEAMGAWEGVFGAHYGAGAMYAIGHAQARRPPRHALLVGARLMLDSSAAFDSHGDELSSYALIPVGYGYLSDSGLYVRATIAPVIIRERKDRALPAGGGAAPFDRVWTISGPMINVGVGYAF